ncbi:MAG: hypothetical protein AAF943_13995 [Pseudomonadota bacterium]
MASPAAQGTPGLPCVVRDAHAMGLVIVERIVKSLLFTLLALSLPALAQAQTSTVPALQEAVAARDFATVDTSLRAAQIAFEEGQLSAEEIRARYAALSRSAPKTSAFVKSWLAGDLRNPRAQIARAQSLRAAGRFAARGQSAVAKRVARAMGRRAERLERAAFATNPRLLPAAEAMLNIHGRADDLAALETVLAQVMGHHPHWGTLRQAVVAAEQSSAFEPQTFCTRAAYWFDQEQQAQALAHCLITALLDAKDEARAAEVANLLAQPAGPGQEMDRLALRLTYLDPAQWSATQIEDAKRLFLARPLNQEDLIRLDSLSSLFGEVWRLQDGPAFPRLFRSVRLARARAFLEHDPRNIDLLDIIEPVIFERPWTLAPAAIGETSLSQTAARPVLEPQRAAAEAALAEDFALRRIEASPFHGGYWADFALLADSRDPPVSMLAGDAARQNAVVYARDPVAALTRLLTAKQTHYRHLEQTVTMPKAQLAELPSWQKFLLNTRVPEQILCPYLRAYLLREALCESASTAQTSCAERSEEGGDRQKRLLSSAKSAPLCANLLSADVATLGYTAVPFTIAVSGQPFR